MSTKNTIIIIVVVPLAEDTIYNNCTDGEIRLEGGLENLDKRTMEGRIEICINNAWGTVCNTYFGPRDAHVACNQLVGFQSEGNPIGAMG